jgi:hypothetical protein
MPRGEGVGPAWELSSALGPAAGLCSRARLLVRSWHSHSVLSDNFAFHVRNDGFSGASGALVAKEGVSGVGRRTAGGTNI